MNKIVIGILVVVILAGGAFFFSMRSAEQPPTAAVTTNTTAEINYEEPTAQTNEVTSTEPAQTNGYVEYSKQALDSAAGNRRVLFFYASWCPTCIPADADFKAQVSSLPSDVTVIRVNYNDPDTDEEEKELARKYAVTYQHTFVQIDETGEKVTIWNGGDMDELLERLN